MPPIALNRRRFLGYSAAAGMALSQGTLAEAAAADGPCAPVAIGVIGIGNRGTCSCGPCSSSPGHRSWRFAMPRQSTGSVVRPSWKKRRGQRPDACDDARSILDRADVDAVVVALPCDAHEATYEGAIAAGKHLYAEKPLASRSKGATD